jgi:hypothetical protein
MSALQLYSLDYLLRKFHNVGFEVFIAVAMKITVFWGVMLYNLLEVYRHLRWMNSLHLAGCLSNSSTNPEGGGSTFLENISKLLQDCMPSPPKRWVPFKFHNAFTCDSTDPTNHCKLYCDYYCKFYSDIHTNYFCNICTGLYIFVIWLLWIAYVSI